MALYAGRGNGFLEPILGPSSLLCADGRHTSGCAACAVFTFRGEKIADVLVIGDFS